MFRHVSVCVGERGRWRVNACVLICFVPKTAKFSVATVLERHGGVLEEIGWQGEKAMLVDIG